MERKEKKTYSDDITIDETALDLEWLEQPRLVMKYGKISANAEREYDKTKVALDMVRAELDRKIRTKPDKYGIEKITESVIMNTITGCDEYQQAFEEFLDAKYEYNASRTALTAVIQRKDALENLVRLHGQQYFAGPRIPRNISEERQIKQQVLDGNIAKKMNKK